MNNNNDFNNLRAVAKWNKQTNKQTNKTVVITGFFVNLDEIFWRYLETLLKTKSN